MATETRLSHPTIRPLWVAFGLQPHRSEAFIRLRTYKTREEARQDVFEYIEMFYKPVRKQVRNGMLSPIQLERQQVLKAEGV